MKRFVLLCFLLFVLGIRQGWTQDRVVAGRLTGANNEPLPGVTIVVKGTATGTTTNAQGDYKIMAPLGSTLIISFIGFTSREVKVTEQNSAPLGTTQGPLKTASQPDSVPVAAKTQRHKIQKPTTITPDGEATLTDDSPTYVRQSGQEYNAQNRYMPPVYKIRFSRKKRLAKKAEAAGQNGVFVLEDAYQQKDQKLRVNYVTSFTLDKINRLPDLQTTYAQGRPVAGTETWQGPETNEIFSWGPPVKNLEYDGVPNAYDQHGSLTPRGQGNGQLAQTYNPTAFFRAGHTYDQSLTLSGKKKGVEIAFNVANRQQAGIFPGNNLNRHNLSLRLKATPLKKLDLNYLVAYGATRNKLPGRGAANANLLASVYLTPPTFDNANGLSRGRALETAGTYTLAPGTQRSFSPGQADNPYWLVNTLPDEDRLNTLVSNITLKYQVHEHISLNYVLGLDRQDTDSQLGLARGSAGTGTGRFTSREEDRSFLSSGISGTYQQYFDWLYLEAGISSAFNHERREVNRLDAAGYDGTKDWPINDGANPIYFATDKTRNRHETASFVLLRANDLVNLRLTNRTYTSTTITKGNYFLPAAGLGFNFTELEPLQYLYDIISAGRIYASFSRSVNEAPLVYSKWHFNSLLYPADRYLSYFEQQELTGRPGIKPEQLTKFEWGAEAGFVRSHIHLKYNSFNNLTRQLLVPVQTNSSFSLQNAADIRNKGFELQASYYKYGKIRLYPAVHFSRVRPVVTRLHANADRLPLAGFTDISTNLVAGEPYGVIYGTRYKRNASGEIIMGADGFPLVSEQPGRIGNPNPSWTAGLSNSMEYGNYSLAFVFDFRKGGEVWNGTQSALNYYGKSKETREARNTRQYIFEGVKEDNSPNTQPVDFANPSQGLARNRWVRYGIAGVGEEAIEKASWLRLSELRFTYKFSKLSQRIIPASQASLSFIGKNLWLHSKYRGVDPASTLFGYEEARGLDFFNAPGTRTFGLAFNLSF